MRGTERSTFYFGPDHIDARLGEGIHASTLDECRGDLARFGYWVLEDLGVDRDALRGMVHSELADLVDALGTATEKARRDARAVPVCDVTLRAT
jgi:hypothetical protein